ncbi:hypothetical protein HP563_12805 [Pantoea dispersa]|uniref:MBL fold metallo-hydrolase n=1 Tax=Pantoea dispersa TaxID=59814 RepID=UPI003526E06E
MNRFIAVKVGKGDAFYLENMGVSFLVDGGASKNRLPLLLSSEATLNDIDILVCTHSDEDHVNGLIGYFLSGKKCKEVWLPGSWMSRLEDMLNTPNEFIKELFENISDLDEDFLINGANTLEGIGDIISKVHTAHNIKLDNGNEIHPPILPYINDENKDNIDSLKDRSKFDTPKKNEVNVNKSSERPSPDKNETSFSQEKLSQFINEVDNTPKDLFPHNKNSQQKISYNRNEIFNSAINAAKKILELATLAYNSGARVRWFEYSETESGGGLRYFHPVNSIEVFQARKRLALEFLCLTKANVESLVFYAYNEDHSAGVLFCADSNFSFQQSLNFLSYCQNLIVTAPHHGAEANRIVYQKLSPYISPNTIFVRSDSRQSTTNKNPRPCADFRNLTYTKYCTICYAQSTKQSVILNYTAGGWSPDNTTGCIC